MTELQIGLLGLGAVAVAGVVVYNTWQEYKHRKLAEQLLKTSHSDVLLDEGESAARTNSSDFSHYADLPSTDYSSAIDLSAPAVRAGATSTTERTLIPEAHERIEPVLSLDLGSHLLVPETDLPREPVTVQRSDPLAPKPFLPLTESFELNEEREKEGEYEAPELLEETVHSEAKVPGKALGHEQKDTVEPQHLLSPVIDYVASFETVEPAPAYQILESQRDVLARIHKPLHWIGYNERAREWEPIIDDGDSEYRRIRIGLQLVDRHGPVSDGDLAVFHMAMQDLADELMAIADMPLRQPALETAAKLDEFCASVDIQIGINVISQESVFPGTKLRALAESAGMVIDAEGRFVRCDDAGNVLYVLLNQEASGFSVDSMKTMSTHGVTFLLDVPRVGHGERVFSQMLDLARRFADVLRGALVDDNRQPLSEVALEPIRKQIGQYQTAMARQGLPAGGALAQRLFS